MRNLKVILAYDGTDFAGWQIQPGRTTVQGTLASAIGRLSGENVLPQGSGRTDAGVHALAQVATFVTASTIPTANWMVALNDNLPPSIRVLAAEEVGSEFHARKSAKAKTYRYRMHRGTVCPPFLARYVWHYPYPLNEAAMVEAASVIAGVHDFTSFAAVDPERVERMSLIDTAGIDTAAIDTLRGDAAASDSRRRDTGDSGDELANESILVGTKPTNVREIFSSTWTREDDEFVYTVRGNGFLHHMVRNLAGTFVLVGKGSLNFGDFKRILDARKRSAAGATAPASGLFLVGVEY